MCGFSVVTIIFSPETVDVCVLVKISSLQSSTS